MESKRKLQGIIVVLVVLSVVSLYRAYQYDGFEGVSIPIVLSVVTALMYGCWAETMRKKKSRAIAYGTIGIFFLIASMGFSIFQYVCDRPGHLLSAGVGLGVGLIIVAIGIRRVKKPEVVEA